MSDEAATTGFATPGSPWRSTLLTGGNRGSWSWSERAHEEEVMNGVEAWVFALRGDYKAWTMLEDADLDRYDLIILNMNFEALGHYERLIASRRERRAKLVGLYEGGLAMLHKRWREWGRVADCCDLVIAINEHGVSFLQSITSAPVRYVGIPYPVDGVARHRVPIEERSGEIFLCAPPLDRPLDYLASRSLGLPMFAYEETFSRRPRELVKHRSLDKMRYLRRAAGIYNDPSLALLPRTNLLRYFERVSRSRLWMNLDPRYTWARYILDAAALAMPIIATRETGHAPHIFPDLVVESPYDIAGATRLAERLRDDDAFYRSVTERASACLDWYRPENAIERLGEVL